MALAAASDGDGDDCSLLDDPAWKAPTILEFSTDVVESRFRLDYWIDAVGKTIAPIVVSASPGSEDFHCRLTAASLDSLTLVYARGCEQESARTRQCLAADVGYSFHLMVDFGLSWSLDWRGTMVHLRPGDLVMTDSRYLQSGQFPRNCSIVNIKMPPVWASAWLEHPERLAGRCIARDRGWGKALSAFVAQLTPELVANAPLPPRLIGQNLGSLLALVESDLLAKEVSNPAKQRQTADRVCDLVRQRASEPGLTAMDIAAALGISERTVHRSMEASGRTFGEVLLTQRIEIARRMLEARHFDRLTTGKIGARAGFADPSYFVRAVTRHLGETPARYRAAYRS